MAAVRITDSQCHKAGVRGGLVADLVDDGRPNDCAGRQTKSNEPLDPICSLVSQTAARAVDCPSSTTGHFFGFPNFERTGTRQHDRRPIVCLRRRKPAFLKRGWRETREMDYIPPDFSFLP